MKRPNALDYLIFRLFRWWWNPILREHPRMAIEFATWMLEWVERYNGIEAADEAQLKRLGELLKDVPNVKVTG